MKALGEGLRPIATDRDKRFLGKVQKEVPACRGGKRAVEARALPWVDWQHYWAAGGTQSKSPVGTGVDKRGVDGALVDLEYERIELIKFNLFDNSGTYEQYLGGRDGLPGSSLKVWPEMRLPKNHPDYSRVGGDGEQLCKGDLIRFRTLTGICNDIRNPSMGSTHQLFGRLVEFESTFPELGENELARNRHLTRLVQMEADPQVISRKLFTRAQTHPERCRSALGLEAESRDAECDYRKANTFNVLAAFWIQFMTHDWFSHLEEGHNRPEMMTMGCRSELQNGVPKPLSAADVKKLGCRPEDRIDEAYLENEGRPDKFAYNGRDELARSYRTTRNNVTAWWDASQLYGYDETSLRRVKRPLPSIVRTFGESNNVENSNEWYSVFASGPGIFGLGSKVYEKESIFTVFNPHRRDIWDIRNPDHVNGGTNHFGVQCRDALGVDSLSAQPHEPRSSKGQFEETKGT